MSSAVRRRAASSNAGFTRAGTAILVAGVLVVGVLLGAAVAGGLESHKSAGASGRDQSSTTQAVTTTTTKQEALEHLLSMVTMDPANGGTAAAGGTVSLQASGVHLADVVLSRGTAGTRPGTSAGVGPVVPGRLDAAGDGWHSTGLLLPSAQYTVSYKVSGPGGLTADGSGNFRTAAPKTPVVVTDLWPVPGISVGVGEPIELTFSHPLSPAQQKAVISRVSIEMSRPVAGGWHWFSPTLLHFRPTEFWPVGEQVQATINLDDLDLGSGAWGEGSYQTQFRIGDAHISLVDLTTHEMTVTDNGQVLYQWPISGGRPEWPTKDGTYIVLDRSSQVQMISSTVGIPVDSPNGYNETVYWDVRISNSGEFVHAAPWSVSEQGIANVSHGCVNVSPANAEAFFHFSRVGDIVEVINSPQGPLATDGGMMDWSFGPSEVAWSPAKVGLLTSTVTTLPTTTEPPPLGAPTTVVPVPTLPPGAVPAPVWATSGPAAGTLTPAETTTATPTTTAPLTTTAPPATSSTSSSTAPATAET